MVKTPVAPSAPQVISKDQRPEVAGPSRLVLGNPDARLM